VYFSSYKRLAYAGMVVVPFVLFWLFYASSGDLGLAIGATVFLTIILIPLQFWQLSRLQSRLDDHDGSIPLGWAFDWDLEDDESDGDSGTADSTGPQPTLRTCSNCGHASFDPEERFCPRCGTSLRP
jgi:hypothetical protein